MSRPRDLTRERDALAPTQEVEGPSELDTTTEGGLPAVHTMDLGPKMSADLLDPVEMPTAKVRAYERLKTDVDVDLTDGVAQTDRMLIADISPDALPPGYLIDDRYEVVSLLGRGGFGAVYKAKQRATGQLVAVKVLLNRDSDPMVAARFEREMAVIARLYHPNIVRLIDSGRMDGGQLFAVLEFIEGGSLAERIRGDGPLSAGLTRRLMAQVLEALVYAHKQGIIHRDLKPQNIMVAGEGALAQARVLDFGLAALAKEARAEDYLSLTGTNQFQGTPGYMSPEQLTHGEQTAKIDIYALGLVFAECLIGRPVMQANSLAALIYLQLAKDAIALPQPLMVTPVGPLIASMIAKDAAERPASTEVILAALNALDWQHPSFAALEKWAQAQDPDKPFDPNDTGQIGSGGWFKSSGMQPGMTGRATAIGTTVRGVLGGSGRWLWVGLGLCLVGIGAALWLLIHTEDTSHQGAAGGGALSANPEGGECGGGKVLLGQDQCCWPGQRWDQAHNRCDGIPARCPEGQRPHATECVPLAEGQRATATLDLPRSQPPGAKVRVNGVEMGQAPLLLEGLPLGDISVVFSLPKHGDVWQFASLSYQNHTLRLDGEVVLVPQPEGVPEDMVAVPAGKFWRGCLPEDQAECEPPELPGGWVELAGFAIDRTEVSLGAYRKCVDAGGCAAPLVQFGPGSALAICVWGKKSSEMSPLNCITWAEANSYCEWAGRRLPTADEWEKAARGPNKQRFPWGDTALTCEHAVVTDESGEGCGREQPWPVGAKLAGASPYGALDMIGNLEEWTADQFEQSQSGRPPQRKVRGGGFDDKISKLRTSKIDDDIQTDTDNDLGFRCAKSLP